MTPSERRAMDLIESLPGQQITIATLADNLSCEERFASRVLLDLQLAGELRSRSESSDRGPARKVYFIPTDACFPSASGGPVDVWC
jgi:hypothetical protein